MKYAVLAGRQLISIIFIIASAGHFTPRTIASAASHHVPLPHLLVPLSCVMALVGAIVPTIAGANHRSRPAPLHRRA